MTAKIVPASATGAPGYSIFYGYDLRGLQTFARFGSASGPGVANAYDGFGRLKSSTTSMDGVARTMSSQYDVAGNRIALSGDSGYHAPFDHDGLGRMTAYRGVVAIGYDKAGRRSSLVMGASTSSALYAYDGVGRLAGLTRELAGSASDLSLGFDYNPASQIVGETRSNDAYAWTGSVAVDRPYSVNGQNQYLTAGPATFAYDANGNLTSDGSTSFVYDAENRLVSASGAKSASLAYDPLGRLWQVTGPSGATRFLYDGDRLVMEYGGSGNVLRSYVHGPSADEPLAWYERSAGWAVRYLHANHQGSIVAVADMYGNPVAINAYDEYGIPSANNVGRFQYTGQAWIPELGLYYYKARFYSPTLGRFLQTDPIGYEDQINLYAYVRNDPVNSLDPTGMDSYMVARPLDSAVAKAGYGHAYIVVGAKYPGDPNARVISFGELANGNMGNVNDPSRASDFSKTTHATDGDHWASLGKDDTGSFSRIDARDTTVSAVAGAVQESGDYDIVPGLDLFGGAPAVNSNSAAMAIAQRSTEISGGDGATQPTGYTLPGVGEAHRVQFNERKICASDGIICK